MIKALKSHLNIKSCETYGLAGGGCISGGSGFRTDIGDIFVKCNNKTGVIIEGLTMIFK